MENRKLKNTGFVKTILMLLVITDHACAFWSGHWFTGNPVIESRGLGVICLWLSSFVTYAFSLASGYLFAYKIHEGGYREYFPFLKNKAKRLLVPYVFVMATWVAPITAYFFGANLPEFFKTFVLCINPCQLWFLWMLFWVFAIVWPLRKVMTERPVTGWFAAIIIYGIGIAGQRVIPNIFCIWSAFEYVPFFCIGMRIRAREESGRKSITESLPWAGWTGIHLTVFVIHMSASGQTGAIWKTVRTGLTFLLNYIGAIAAWTVLQALAASVNRKGSRFFGKLYSRSMPMYLYHQQIIYFVIVWLNGKVNPWINTGVNFAAALTGSFLISSILMHWKTTRFLIGEK